MKLNLLLAVFITLFLLSGCASTGKNQSQQGQVKRITPEELEKLLPPPIATFTLEEIIFDSKQGKSVDEVIDKIKTSESRYDLDTAEVLDLSKQGVDVNVLDYIQQANELANQNAIAEQMNKVAKEKENALRQLRHERLFSRDRFYNPFWYSRFGLYSGHPFGYRYHPGSRFGW